MGLHNFGLNFNTATHVTSDDNQSALYIDQDTAFSHINVSWRASVGGTRNWSFSIYAAGYVRATGKYQHIGDGYTNGITLDSITEKNGHRYVAKLHDMCTLCGVPNFEQNFNNTAFDTVQFSMSLYPDGSPEYRISRDFRLYYYPKPTSGQIGMSDSNTLNLRMTLPSDWVDGDLSMIFGGIVDSDGTYVKPNNAVGYVDIEGSFSDHEINSYIPINKLTKTPKLNNGDSLQTTVSLLPSGNPKEYLPVTFNATVVKLALDDISASGVRNADGSVTVTASGGGATVTDWTFSIDGSPISSDTITNSTGKATWVSAPSNEFYVTVKAYNSTTKASGSTRVKIPAGEHNNCFRLSRVDNSVEPVVGIFNIQYSESGEKQKEIIQLAGRAKPCAYYGQGGSRKYSVSWAFAPDGVSPSPIQDSIQIQNLRKMCDGDCIADLPNGERLKVSVGYPNISRAFNNQAIGVSIEIEEVS